MKKTKLNIALADIMARTLSDEIDGSPNLHIRREPQLQELRKEHHDEVIARGRWTAENPQLQELRKEHHDEFIVAELAAQLRDFGQTAASRMREEQASSFAHLAVQAANAGYAMQSTISLKELGQLALKCHELRQRAPAIELSHHDFFKLLSECGPQYDIDRANAVAGDAEFYYNGAFFRLNPGLPAGRAKVIENER